MVQTTGGSLRISKDIHQEPRDLHGLEDKHDKLVVDSLLFVKDTVPGADEEEHHCLSAYTPIERWAWDLQVSMMIPSLATQIPPHTFRMTDRLRLYCLESATVSIVTLGASKPLMLTLVISTRTVSLHLLETHDETGDDE